MKLKIKNIIKNLKGITLAEMMVSSVIFTFIIGGLYTSLIAGSTSWQNFEAAVRAQQDARSAMALLGPDLRVGQTIAVTEDVSGNTTDLSFFHPDQGSITYSWTDTGNDAFHLIRQTDTQTRTIANNISAFNVTDAASDVTINITATVQAEHGEASSFQLSQKVAKR